MTNKLPIKEELMLNGKFMSRIWIKFFQRVVDSEETVEEGKNVLNSANSIVSTTSELDISSEQLLATLPRELPISTEGTETTGLSYLPKEVSMSTESVESAALAFLPKESSSTTEEINILTLYWIGV